MWGRVGYQEDELYRVLVTPFRGVDGAVQRFIQGLGIVATPFGLDLSQCLVEDAHIGCEIEGAAHEQVAPVAVDSHGEAGTRLAGQPVDTGGDLADRFLELVDLIRHAARGVNQKQHVEIDRLTLPTTRMGQIKGELVGLSPSQCRFPSGIVFLGHHLEG